MLHPLPKVIQIESWMEYDKLHPAPTFFARPAWSLALARVFPELVPWPVAMHLSTGERVFVPLVSRRGRVLPFRTLCGLPFGSYTLVLREDGGVVSEHGAVEAIAHLLGLGDATDINYWPLTPLSGNLQAQQHPRETFIVDLSLGAERAIANMDGRALRNVHAAVRRGITCQQDREPGNADRYYDLLADTAKKWESGTPTISRALIEAVMKCGGEDTEIWFSYHEGNIVAGALLFYGSEEAFSWSSAMRPEYGNLRPSNALNVALIKRAAERGMRWFNMGASEGLPGVTQFKKSLGATPLGYVTYSAERPSHAIFRKIRNAVSMGMMS